MTDTKGLGKQIETHRKELEALRADEAELARLHAEKSAELEAMRGGKSRDFAGMAALEGQRAALQTMLGEQRGEIGQTEARVADLERQAARVDHITELGRRADRVQSLIVEGLSALGASADGAAVPTDLDLSSLPGPILQIVRIDDFDQAIAEATNTRFGLSASLIGGTPQEYNRFWANVRAGIINWNRPTSGASSKAPFGGLGLSGNHRPAAFYAAKVEQDNSVDRLIVATDPDFIATREFEEVFGEGEFAPPVSSNPLMISARCTLRRRRRSP